MLFSLCCQIALGKGCTNFTPLSEMWAGTQPLLEGSPPLGRGQTSWGNVSVLWMCLPLGSPLEPRELCAVVTDNNLKMRSSLLFSALLHIYWHKSTPLHFHSDVCQKIPAGSRYHKPFCTLAPCLTPLQMHLKGELLAWR